MSGMVADRQRARDAGRRGVRRRCLGGGLFPRQSYIGCTRLRISNQERI